MFLFSLKGEILKVKAEIVADTSRGLRLSRHLQKRLDKIVSEIEEIDTDHLGVLLLGVLFETDEGKALVAHAAKIKTDISSFRGELYFLGFLTP